MKNFLLVLITAMLLCTIPNLSNAQVPDLGAAYTFAVFTGAGAFTNDGATIVTGDIGTNVGMFSGFPPGVVIGETHVADDESAAAATAVANAYAILAGTTCGQVIGTTLGNGDILTPDVYCLGAASTLNGDLVLDAENDPDAIFIFRIDGALSTSTLSNVVLINGASLCNVWWQINGAFDLGQGSMFRGNVLANGAISLLEGSSLFGRALATVGAVALHNNVVSIGLPPVAAIIVADGSTSFCIGDSVVLSGNVDGVWNTGAVTSSITVSTSGDFFVINTTLCGSDTSNHILVTVNPLPNCTITGALSFCEGQSSELCLPPGEASYLWSTGETTDCITVSTAGVFAATVTDFNGCTNTCSVTVIVNPDAPCTITGDLTFCEGASSELCVAAGAASYIWSTGETTNCITVDTAGTFSVTITGVNGCSSTCSATVIVNPDAPCTITGDVSICEGQSTDLCVLPGAASYIWSTGETTNCITVDTAGTFSVTITGVNGCSSTCSATVIVNPDAPCTITGDLTFCEGESSELCVAEGAASYLWSTGETTNCITVSTTGIFSVTVTSVDGCVNSCAVLVIVNPAMGCLIIGDFDICEGQSTELCVAAGASTFLWSTGETTDCITVSEAGDYSVTISNIDECFSSCSATVTVNPLPICTMTGELFLCEGQSTELCVPPGAASYLWSTGETTNCITVNVEGEYAVTITSADGCVSSCSETVTIDLVPTCTITGDVSFCEGQSTDLCVPPGATSYLWSTGEITNCITVSVAGDFSVTVTSTDGCISTCSVTVTIDVLPLCSITGEVSFCEGQSSELCASPGAASYLWSTGEITDCITVSTEGEFAVTVTSVDGCTSTCSVGVTIDLVPLCLISGDVSLCEGQSTDLCVLPGAASYEWSTGETTSCITVSTAGVFSVTITSANGCISSCSATVTINPLPLCSITGELDLCEGQSTDLCVLPGAASYLWSTGETTNCITVDASGLYAVTVTSVDGCTSACSATVTIDALSVCSITGNLSICPGESTDLCVPAGAASYLWNTGATTSCITVSVAGTYSVTVTDLNGCTSACSQEVIVSPDVPPEIVCPVDMTVECDESTLPSNTGTATAIGFCGLVPTITFTDSFVPGICPQESTITRTWTATVGIGNSMSCTQSISIVDSTVPVIVCPADITIECDESTLPSNTGIATASDNCNLSPVVSFSDIVMLGTCPNEHLIARTWLALDGCDNSATCVQLITVTDNTPPVITLINPLLGANGDTTFIQCYGQDPQWDLPEFDESSVEATDICAGTVTVNYSQVLLNEGDCTEDGYIILYRLTWTATDACGNSSSAFVFMALVDTIAPVIYGVPGDTTVNCDEIPDLPVLVYATDECLCACVILLQESQLPAGCQNGGVLLRTWRARDRCGNETVVTQRITIVDNQGPLLVMIEPEMEGMHDGTILEYTCSEGGLPEFLASMDAQSVLSAGVCGGTALVTFTVTTQEALNCEFYGYIEQRTYQWTATDACGNETTLTIIARLLDNEPPVLIGVPEMTCVGDPALQNIYALDNCSNAYSHFWDVTIANPCGTGTAVRRTYEAYDDCGNSSRDTTILIPNDANHPSMQFVNPTMTELELGEVLVVNCAAHDGRYTSFDVDDVNFADACEAGVTTTFTERLLETGDCTTGGFVAIVELQWMATDICGNLGVLTLIAHVVDESSPVFVNFQPKVTIRCQDVLPAYSTTDNCSDVSITTRDSIVQGDCAFEYVIYRVVTATDYCGNTATRLQTIQVGDGNGPVIAGVEEEVCDDLTIPIVTAYDACAGVFVEVTMEQDTLDVPCRDGLVIQRTWTAVDVCGHVTVIHQTIVMHDQTPPEILIPGSSIINYILDNGNALMYFSQTDLMHLIDLLDENSVLVTDECDEDINAVLTVDVLQGDCEEDGYSERRVYTWVATDVCGNSTSVSVTIDIMDDVPPQIVVIPSDTIIVCVDLPPAPDILVDTQGGETIVYTQVIEPGINPNEFIVTRTWVATDSCGNATVVFQRIVWIPESYLECEILLPPSLECNSHGVVIGSIVTGGFAPYTYVWQVVGEKCFIQGGQGTPEIIVYVGWSDVKIILTVTDTFGCVTMCMVILHCELELIPLVSLPDDPLPLQANTVHIGPTVGSGENLTQLNLWPNPTSGSLTISFESEMNHQVQFTLTNFLGQVVLSEKLQAVRGLNIHKANLEFLPPGSYLMQVKTDKEMHTKVVVVMPRQ